MAAESERRIGGRQWESNPIFRVVLFGQYWTITDKSMACDQEKSPSLVIVGQWFRHFFDSPCRGICLENPIKSYLIIFSGDITSR